MHSPEEVNEIPEASLGRLLMIDKLLDKQAQEYLYIYRKKGGIVNEVVAVATAKALIERSNLEHFKELDLEYSSWAKSLFTTGRSDIPEGTKKEAEIIFLHQVVDLVEEKKCSILIDYEFWRGVPEIWTSN